MKDMGDASYVIDIKIHRDRSWDILGLSQETYIKKNLEEKSNQSNLAIKNIKSIRFTDFSRNKWFF